MILFIAELSGIEIWGTDISNAYLEALISEYVCSEEERFCTLQGRA